MSYRFLQYRSPRFPAGRVGLVSADGTRVVPIDFPSGRPVVDLKVLIRDWDTVASSLLPSHAVESISAVEIFAPVTGRDIICVGKNYLEHARFVLSLPSDAIYQCLHSLGTHSEFQQSGWDGSSKDDVPKKPVVFTKRATSIIGTNTPIHPHSHVTSKLDYEGELAIIVGKGGRNIKKADAWEHVWGACILNDVSCIRSTCAVSRLIGVCDAGHRARPPARPRPVLPRQVARHLLPDGAFSPSPLSSMLSQADSRSIRVPTPSTRPTSTGRT